MADAASRLTLRVIPGARRAAVVGRYAGGLKVRVTAPPERGRANEEALELLAVAFSLPRRALEIVSGHGSRDKIVALEGIDAAELERRLEGAA